SQDPSDPGVLVLSRFAGAAEQMKEALIVNPYDLSEMAEAMNQALAMPLDERVERWQSLMAGLRRTDVVSWREDYLASLAGTREAAQPSIIIQASPGIATGVSIPPLKTRGGGDGKPPYYF